MAKNAMYLSLLVIIGFALTSQSFADKVDSTTLNDLKKEGKDTIEKTEEIPSNKQNDESILKEEEDTAENDVKESDDKVQESSTEEAEDEGKGSENYGQGSVCVYCQYCKVYDLNGSKILSFVIKIPKYDNAVCLTALFLVKSCPLCSFEWEAAWPILNASKFPWYY